MTVKAKDPSILRHAANVRFSMAAHKPMSFIQSLWPIKTALLHTTVRL